MINRALFPISLCLCLILSACGGEPSSAEITKAVEDLFKNDSSMTAGKKILGILAATAGVQDIKVDSIDKIGCEPDGKNAYSCEVAVEYTISNSEGSLSDLLGVGGHKRSINKYRLVKTSKGWIIDESAKQ
jgi:hypothetical protein